jgi:hypothetical protein
MLKKFSSYLKENKYQLINAVRKIIAVYSENYTKRINTLCWKDTEIFNIIAGGTHTVYCCALKGLGKESSISWVRARREFW